MNKQIWHRGDILLSRGRGLLSRLICWWTRSRFSHARAVISDRLYIEATWPCVRVGLLSDIKITKDIIRLRHKVGLTDEEAIDLCLYLVNRLGTKYDWRGFISFLIGKSIQKKSWYFCSELIAEAYASLNKPLLRREAHWVTPQDIYQSLELVEVEWYS